MKKILSLFTFISIISLTACSSDDDSNDRGGYSTCMSCVVAEDDSYEVCKGSNGNAYVEDTDSGIDYEEYTENFCE